MASETNLTDVERAINQLQGVLKENYLAAEKIMAILVNLRLLWLKLTNLMTN